MTREYMYRRTRTGNRFYVRAEIRTIQHQETGHTITHAPIPIGAVEVSFVGTLVRKGGRLEDDGSIITGGQILDELPARDPLRSLWGRWHAGGLQSLCVHQTNETDDTMTPPFHDPYRAKDWDQRPICPHTGYRPGSAWLAEPLPANVAARLQPEWVASSSDSDSVLAPQTAHWLEKDGLPVGIAYNDRDRCLEELHRLVPYSWDHALTHEGWTIRTLAGLLD